MIYSHDKRKIKEYTYLPTNETRCDSLKTKFSSLFNVFRVKQNFKLLLLGCTKNTNVYEYY